MTDSTKTALIVGAGPGIGASVARAFGALGYRVAVLARSADRLAGLVDELAAAGVDAKAFTADVADGASVGPAPSRL